MVQAVEHARIRVDDLESAVQFYTEVMGLVEHDRDNDAVYFGCGLDDRFDLAVEPGGVGLDHFAIRVDKEEFAERRTELEEADIPVQVTDGEEPGQQLGLQFDLPSGITAEFVTVENDPRYSQISTTAHPDRGSQAPVAFDHVNLMSQDVQSDMEFLVSHANFSLTEVQRNEETGNWDMVFTRYRDQHHDVACVVTDSPDYNLHHIAWTMTNVAALTTLNDELVRNDIEIEAGVSRHLAGNNLYSYFWGPGGNRNELSTEMTSTLHTDTETLYRDRSFTFTSWGGIKPPESFYGGS